MTNLAAAIAMSAAHKAWHPRCFVPASMKVRIVRTPREREIDGVKLAPLAPGTVRNFSSSVGSWLIAAGYGEPEMRDGETQQYAAIAHARTPPAGPRKPRRRSTDR